MENIGQKQTKATKSAKQKNMRNPKLLDFLRKLHVFCILNTLKVIFRWYKENVEHLNVSFRIFFVKHFFCILNLNI